MNRADRLLGKLRTAVSQTLTPQGGRPPIPPVGALRDQVRAAAGAGGPQDALAGVCAGIALRDLNLVDALLAELDRMEAREENPDALAELYRLDHLATRLRRNAENLRVLSGRDDTGGGSQTQHLVDVIRAAMSSIEQYARVTIGRVVSLGVVGFAADDLGRILAELLDNATAASPPVSPVRVSAHLTEQGSVLVRIEDEGIGLPPERVTALNSRLSSAPVLDRRSVQHMGLAVVGRLAYRHRVRVRLDRRTPTGTIATVLVPASLVSDLPQSVWSGEQTVRYPTFSRGRTAPPIPGAAKTNPAIESPVDGRIGGGYASTRSAAPEGGAGEHTRNGLPRRRSAPAAPPATATASAPTAPLAASAPTAARADSGDPQESAGTTANGLPRRVPRSIRHSARVDPGAGSRPEPAPGPQAPETDSAHNRFAADLGAFADGTKAAHENQSTSAPEEQ